MQQTQKTQQTQQTQQTITKRAASFCVCLLPPHVLPGNGNKFSITSRTYLPPTPHLCLVSSIVSMSRDYEQLFDESRYPHLRVETGAEAKE